MTATRPSGIYSDIDEEAYHTDRDSLSVSGAKLLLPPSCPAKFRWQMSNPRKPKREFDFGHVAHTLILGKGAEVVVIDAPDFRTKDAREQRDQAHARGQVPILQSEYSKALLMAGAVLDDPIAGPLFAEGSGGQAEMSLYATDPVTGVQLRGRTDWLTTDIDDVKTSTTANPAELERKFWTLSYFMQAAWYIDLVKALGLSDDPEFRFVVVEKEPPHIVTVVRYTADAIAEGRRLNRQAIDLYARCKAADHWPGYTDQIVTIDLPRWAYRDGIDADAAALITELEGITS